MKALSIHQPYASLIANGKKWVENRSWETLYRGPLAICASKGSRYLSKSELKKYDTGRIVAVCRLQVCLHHQTLHDKFYSNEKEYRGINQYGMRQILNHAHTEGPWLFVLNSRVKLETPIPITGRQGLFNLPADLAKRLEALLP